MKSWNQLIKKREARRASRPTGVSLGLSPPLRAAVNETPRTPRLRWPLKSDLASSLSLECLLFRHAALSPGPIFRHCHSRKISPRFFSLSYLVCSRLRKEKSEKGNWRRKKKKFVDFAFRINADDEDELNYNQSN